MNRKTSHVMIGRHTLCQMPGWANAGHCCEHQSQAAAERAARAVRNSHRWRRGAVKVVSGPCPNA